MNYMIYQTASALTVSIKKTCEEIAGDVREYVKVVAYSW
jgi:hypothetical protein